MKEYKYLFFDLDNTVFDFSKGEQLAVKETFEHIGVAFNDENLEKYRKCNADFWIKFEKGIYKKAAEAAVRFINLKKLIPFESNDFDEINSFYLRTLSRYAYPFDGSDEILKRLCGKYDIYIVTNGLHDVATPRVNGSVIKPYIKDLFISEDIGYSKPSKEYFEYCFGKIEGFEPEKALVIGDNLSSDILGGINAGLDTCWYNFRFSENETDIKPTYEIHRLKEVYEILGD